MGVVFCSEWVKCLPVGSKVATFPEGFLEVLSGIFGPLAHSPLSDGQLMILTGPELNFICTMVVGP